MRCRRNAFLVRACHAMSDTASAFSMQRPDLQKERGIRVEWRSRESKYGRPWETGTASGFRSLVIEVLSTAH
jgi:hypothetical protein